MNRGVNARLTDEEIVVDYGDMIFGQLDVCSWSVQHLMSRAPRQLPN